jgi:hypothetical protein
MRYHKTLNNEQERWMCSRHTIGEDADGEVRHCQGSARRFPWEAELKPHTYHSEWCKPVPNDEEVSLPPTSLHHLRQHSFASDAPVQGRSSSQRGR